MARKLVYSKGMHLRTGCLLICVSLAGMSHAEVQYKVWVSELPVGANPTLANIVPIGVDATGQVAIRSNLRDNMTPFYVSSLRSGQTPQFQRNGFGHGMASNGDVCLQEWFDNGQFGGRYDATLLRADGTVAKTVQPTLENHNAYATAVGEDGDTLAGFDYQEIDGYWFNVPWIHKNGVKSWETEIGPGFITDINKSGDYCGVFGGFNGKGAPGSFFTGSFYKRNGQFHTVGNIPGTDDGVTLNEMNDKGVIAGYSQFNKPYLFDTVSGEWTGFDVVGGFLGINNHGVAVGSGQRNSSDNEGGAFITVGGKIRFLSDLVSPEIASQYVLGSAWAINDSGVIAVEGYKRGPQTTAHQTFILTPVPEPGTLLALGLGIAALRRRSKPSA